MILLFANNAITTLADPITAASTTVQVAAGTGALFPQPVAGQQFFKLTLISAADTAVNEIVNVTAVNGDVFTIVRAQEGTAATAFNAGDSAENLTTAQTQQNFIQVQQAQSGQTNTAQDTGTPNNYVVAMTPAVTTRIFGLYVRILAANSNTGPSTLNLGAGSCPIVNPDGSALGDGAIVGGGFFEVVDDGVANYQLISASQEAQTTSGIATTGDISWRPTTETKDGWAIANGTTVGNAASNATQIANATTANLFTWLWTNFPNTQCPVLTSAGVETTRGANPAADFAANLQITLLDLGGIAQLGMDDMGGKASDFYAGVPAITGSPSIAGSFIGETLHTLTAAQIPTIDASGDGSAVVDSTADVLVGASPEVANLEGGPSPVNVISGGGELEQVGSTGSASVTTTSTNTGGGSHNTVDRGMVGTFYIKL
jgi:hypothetical protein